MVHNCQKLKIVTVFLETAFYPKTHESGQNYFDLHSVNVWFKNIAALLLLL